MSSTGRGPFVGMCGVRFWSRLVRPQAVAAIAGLGMSLATGAVAIAQPVVSNWVPIYEGISYANGRDRSGPQSVQAMRIDLLAPGLRFTTTESRAAQFPGFETFSETTGAFLTRTGAQAAINANFFSVVSTTAQPQQLSGLAVSNGTVVSPAEGGFSSLLLSAGNAASILSAPTPADVAGAFNAVSGGAIILQNGAAVNVPAGQPGDPANPNPRTAVGISQDNRYLYLMTIDGRRTGLAAGTTQMATGDWLARFGAFTGLNLDGGGSTTMIRSDNRGGALALNRPSGNSQRLNGNNLAVFAGLLDPGSARKYSQAAQAQLPTGYFRFNEAAGTASLADSAPGSARTASVAGTGVSLGAANAAITTDTSTAARFNGTSAASRINIAYDPALNRPSFSVAVWAMVEGGPANTFQGVVSSRNDKGSGAAGNAGWVVYAGPATGASDLRWQFWTGGTTTNTYNFLGRNQSGYGLGPSVRLNQWQLIVGTFDAITGPDANGRYTGTQSLYVDGVLALQLLNVSFLPNIQQAMTVGSGGNETTAGSFPMFGRVDELSIFDYALTGGDVANLYAAAVPAPTAGSLLLGVGIFASRRRRVA